MGPILQSGGNFDSHHFENGTENTILIKSHLGAIKNIASFLALILVKYNSLHSLQRKRQSSEKSESMLRALWLNSALVLNRLPSLNKLYHVSNL